MDNQRRTLQNSFRPVWKGRISTSKYPNLLYGKGRWRHFQVVQSQYHTREEITAVTERYYFNVKRNEIYERVKFNTRRQKDKETGDMFVTSLYCLAKHCEYGSLQDELIRDRLVVGIKDTNTSEKLQLETDLSLETSTSRTFRTNRQPYHCVTYTYSVLFEKP